MATEYNTPEWITGDTESLAFIITDDTGAPLNLTGYTGKMQVKASVNGISLAESTAVIDATAGKMTFNFTATQTANLRGSAPGTLIYDAQSTSDTGVVTTEIYGNIPVRLDITR